MATRPRTTTARPKRLKSTTPVTAASTCVAIPRVRSTSGAGPPARAKCTATAPTRRFPAEVRAAVTPKVKADNPPGQWNRFLITLKADRLTVLLNGQVVVENAQLPGIPPKGPIALQHYEGTVQFMNLFVKELD